MARSQVNVLKADTQQQQGLSSLNSPYPRYQIACQSSKITGDMPYNIKVAAVFIALHFQVYLAIAIPQTTAVPKFDA